MNDCSQKFSKDARLLTACQFSRVFDHNDRRASSQNALLLCRTNGLPQSRLGLVIAKKNVKLANQRNRVKRVVREFFRTHTLCESGDLIFLARRGLSELSNQELHKMLERMWAKLDKKSAS